MPNKKIRAFFFLRSLDLPKIVKSLSFKTFKILLFFRENLYRERKRIFMIFKSHLSMGITKMSVP